MTTMALLGAAVAFLVTYRLNAGSGWWSKPLVGWMRRSNLPLGGAVVLGLAALLGSEDLAGLGIGLAVGAFLTYLPRPDQETEVAH